MSNDYVHQTFRAYDNSSDKYYKSTVSLVLKPELDWLVSRLAGKNGLVLDAGCAYGRDMAYLGTKGIKTVGIDLSQGLLSIGRRLYPDMEFQKMDVRHLTFPAKKFDAIWCAAVLLHLKDDDINIALEEFHRVLKDNGLIFISFKASHGSQALEESFTADGARFYNFQSVESLNKLLAATGFRVLKQTTVNERRRFGADKRDLDWIHCFAAKRNKK